MSGCIDDAAVAAWLAGELAAGELGAAVEHVADCARCRAVVALVVGEPAPAAATIGRYVVRGSLGAGGMGVVLDAWDPVLERPTAIKMIQAALDLPADRARLLAEARALARLEHPAVVAVYECGEAGDELFVAMARVDGVTLDQWLDAAAPSVAARLAVLREVAAGLAAIHAAGLVHRDLKPANVVVEPGGRAVIVDLGLARALDRPVVGVGSGLAGTPAYWAPEVAAGQPASSASDQHGWWRLVQLALPTLPGPAGRRLARAVERGLAAEPEARFPSMTAAAEALARAVAPRPWRGRAALALAGVAVAMALGWWRWSRPPPRDPCPARAVAALRPALARVTATLVASGRDPAPVARELAARAQLADALAIRACRAEGTGEAARLVRARQQRACVDATWGETVRAVDGVVAAPAGQLADALEDVAVAPPLAACEAGAVPAMPAPPPLERAAAVAAGEAALREVRADPARAPGDQLTALDALGPRLAAIAHAPLLATWHHDRARVLMELGRLDASDRELVATATAASAANDDDLRARALINRLRLAYQTGRADTGPLVDDAAAAVARLANPAFTAELDVGVARAALVRGDVATAVERLRGALAVYDALPLPTPRRTTAVLQDLGAALQAIGDLDAAQAAFERGYQLARAAFGDDDPATVELRGARATNLLYQDDPAAEPELAAVAAAMIRAQGPRSRDVMQVQTYRCELYLMRGAIDAGAEPCRAGAAIGAEVFGADSPQRVWPLVLLGRYLLLAGQPAAAVDALAHAVAIGGLGAPLPSLPALARAYLAHAQRAAGAPLPPSPPPGAPSASCALPPQSDVTAMLAELAAAFP
ncbi:MAG: serine/threonine-protein kinase [Kofleriaceae bacterium]